MAAIKDGCDRIFCGSLCTHWGATDEQRPYWPPRHSDFRDSTPLQMDKVYELYQPVVQEGRWTEGLLEMWWRKNKPVKTAVHVPCWDSFKWDPRKWRGSCFGRTPTECYWTGLRQMRWARAVYAANLGREYVMPFRGVGKHGYKSEIKALCWMYWLMGCIFSCGIGQLATCCGSCLITNFGAWYSCHARERLRRRYNLPPSCGLPPGIDDCLVHFFCFYCASHQETRELAVRGIDGPGMHILDVLPNSFPNAPGIEEAKAHRRKLVEGMLAQPPKMFRARGVKRTELTRQKTRLQVAVAGAAMKIVDEYGEPEPDDLSRALDDLEASTPRSSSVASNDSALGWTRYCPPADQARPRS
ncbi:hypothetical protein ABPG75_007078 [Micractinium tetrahymenae]